MKMFNKPRVMKGPFESRSASVIDLSTGMYVVYCPHDHHGNKLDANKNAEIIAEALNGYIKDKH